MTFFIIWIVIWLGLVSISLIVMDTTTGFKLERVFMMIAYWLIWPLTIFFTIFSVIQHRNKVEQLRRIFTMDLD